MRARAAAGTCKNAGRARDPVNSHASTVYYIYSVYICTGRISALSGGARMPRGLLESEGRGKTRPPPPPDEPLPQEIVYSIACVCNAGV